MSGSPVRLAIASRDRLVARGLQRMLADHPHRVVVVEGRAAADGVDVVLHDEGAEPDVGDPDHDAAVSWVPLRYGVERILALVEAAAAIDPGAGLSDRERQVMALIAEGLTNQQIADRMYVSINSVKTYIRAAYRKVGVSTRSQAVVWGLRHGFSAGRSAR